MKYFLGEIRALGACALTLTVVGCGGGGGGGDTVDKTTPSYLVGGTVAGLAGSGLVLQNNGGSDLQVGTVGNFNFPNGFQQGTAYAVTVRTLPTNPSQTCVVANGAGTLSTANITNVAVTCTTNTYRVGGV